MPTGRLPRNPRDGTGSSASPDRLVGLAELLESVPGVTRHENSRWAEGLTFHVGAREIAHFHRDGSLDVRLTSDVIRQLKAAGSMDPRVQTRGPSAQWVKLPIRDSSDFALAIALLEEGVRANQ